MDINKWSDKIKYGGMYISELEKLHEICKGKNVLEIGSMVGMSSGVIADSADHVTCVDIWGLQNHSEIIDKDSRDHYIEWEAKIGNSYDDFIKNIEPWKDKIDIFIGTSREFFVKNVRSYDVILLDGDHSYLGVLEDTYDAIQCLNYDGLLCYHDYGHDEWTGVKDVCDHVDHESYLDFTEQVETLRIYRRVK